MRVTASDAFREKLRVGLAAETPPARAIGSSRAAGATRRAIFSGAALAAAAVAGAMLMPAQGQPVMDQVVAGHIRALQADHLADVASTDRHTVKPWFDGKLDFAPPVRDLAGEGFPLTGGRLDFIADRPVAALVYERGRHPINMFVWPEAGGTTTAQASVRKGYNVVQLRDGGMAIWAVSDLEAAELAHFVALWRAAG